MLFIQEQPFILHIQAIKYFYRNEKITYLLAKCFYLIINYHACVYMKYRDPVPSNLAPLVMIKCYCV